MVVNKTDRLLELIKPLGFSSIAQFCKSTGVSEKSLRKIRRGKLEQMQLATLQEIAQALNLSLTSLLANFSEVETSAESAGSEAVSSESGDEPSIATPESTTSLDSGHSDSGQLQQEYDRLQQQLQQQREVLQQEFQQASLQTLEPWLLQWSAAAYAAEQNPEAPAVKLLPLVRPVENLLQSWGIEAIGAVGETVSYDPQLHQLVEGEANPGDSVTVRYVGYRQGDRLLHRSKVAP